MSDVLRTVKDIARATGFSEKTVRRRISDGKLPAYKAGGRWQMDKRAADGVGRKGKA